MGQFDSLVQSYTAGSRSSGAGAPALQAQAQRPQDVMAGLLTNWGQSQEQVADNNVAREGQWKQFMASYAQRAYEFKKTAGLAERQHALNTKIGENQIEATNEMLPFQTGLLKAQRTSTKEETKQRAHEFKETADLAKRQHKLNTRIAKNQIEATNEMLPLQLSLLEAQKRGAEAANLVADFSLKDAERKQLESMSMTQSVRKFLGGGQGVIPVGRMGDLLMKLDPAMGAALVGIGEVPWMEVPPEVMSERLGVPAQIIEMSRALVSGGYAKEAMEFYTESFTNLQAASSGAIEGMIGRVFSEISQYDWGLYPDGQEAMMSEIVMKVNGFREMARSKPDQAIKGYMEWEDGFIKTLRSLGMATQSGLLLAATPDETNALQGGDRDVHSRLQKRVEIVRSSARADLEEVYIPAHTALLKDPSAVHLGPMTYLGKKTNDSGDLLSADGIMALFKQNKGTGYLRSISWRSAELGKNITMEVMSDRPITDEDAAVVRSMLAERANKAGLEGAPGFWTGSTSVAVPVIRASKNAKGEIEREGKDLNLRVVTGVGWLNPKEAALNGLLSSAGPNRSLPTGEDYRDYWSAKSKGNDVNASSIGPLSSLGLYADNYWNWIGERAPDSGSDAWNELYDNFIDFADRIQQTTPEDAEKVGYQDNGNAAQTAQDNYVRVVLPGLLNDPANNGSVVRALAVTPTFSGTEITPEIQSRITEAGQNLAMLSASQFSEVSSFIDFEGADPSGRELLSVQLERSVDLAIAEIGVAMSMRPGEWESLSDNEKAFKIEERYNINAAHEGFADEGDGTIENYDRLRSSLWRTAVLPTLFKGLEAEAPSMYVEADPENVDAEPELSLEYEEHLAKRAMLDEFSKNPPGMSYVNDTSTTQGYANKVIHSGRLNAMLDKLKGASPVSSGGLRNDMLFMLKDEDERSSIADWSEFIQMTLASGESSEKELKQTYNEFRSGKNLPSWDAIPDSVKTQFRKIGSSAFRPEDLRTQLPVVYFPLGHASGLVEPGWTAVTGEEVSDFLRDTATTTIGESDYSRMRRVGTILSAYAGQDMGGAAVRGIQRDEAVALDSGLAVASRVFGVSDNDLGVALKERVNNFMPSDGATLRPVGRNYRSIDVEEERIDILKDNKAAEGVWMLLPEEANLEIDEFISSRLMPKGGPMLDQAALFYAHAYGLGNVFFESLRGPDKQRLYGLNHELMVAGNRAIERASSSGFDQNRKASTIRSSLFDALERQSKRRSPGSLGPNSPFRDKDLAKIREIGSYNYSTKPLTGVKSGVRMRDQEDGDKLFWKADKSGAGRWEDNGWNDLDYAIMKYFGKDKSLHGERIRYVDYRESASGDYEDAKSRMVFTHDSDNRRAAQAVMRLTGNHRLGFDEFLEKILYPRLQEMRGGWLRYKKKHLDARITEMIRGEW